MFLYVYFVFVLSCVGSGPAMGWSPVQGVLLTDALCSRESNRNMNEWMSHGLIKILSWHLAGWAEKQWKVSAYFMSQLRFKLNTSWIQVQSIIAAPACSVKESEKYDLYAYSLI
jgi:hypothetical protein